MNKILVVDDEAAIVEVLRDILQEAGYQVLTAMDGMHGTMLAIRHRPDLILLDIAMPAGSGLDVLDRLKKSPDTQTIPVVFVTAMPLPKIAELVPKGKTVTVLQKPFKNEDLLDLVKSLV